MHIFSTFHGRSLVSLFYFSIAIRIVKYAGDLVLLAEEETVTRAWLIDWLKLEYAIGKEMNVECGKKIM
jgi:hypothetical protein